jgi:hypothetical protein
MYDVLAREAKLNSLNASWRSDFPTCIQVLLVREKLSLDPVGIMM